MLRTTLKKPFNLALPRPESVSPTLSCLQRFRRLYENSRSSAPWPHGPHRAILFLGETDSRLQRSHVKFKAGYYMVDSHCREYLGRAFRLIGFDPHLVTGDFLVILLAEDGDHVERRAPRQSSGNQFNRLWAGTSGGIVQQQDRKSVV